MRPGGLDGRPVRSSRAKLEALRGQTQLGAPIPVGRPLTVGSYLEEWLTVTLPGEVLAGRLKRSTRASYTDHTRRHILPALGQTNLVDPY